MTDGECISPGAVAPNDWIAYLHENATPSVAAHIRACPYCLAKVQSLAELQRSLQSILRRFDCPSPQQIGEYALGVSAPEQRDQLAAHLVDCPRCTAELVSMRAFFADNPLP